MSRSHESMHTRPGYKIIDRYLNRQDIVNQLELIAQCILSFMTEEGITITCAHSTSLIKPNLSAEQSLFSMKPVRIAESHQAGPLPTLTVEIEASDPNQLLQVRNKITQLCMSSPFVIGPVYPRQTAQVNGGTQEKLLKDKIVIGPPTRRHRTVS